MFEMTNFETQRVSSRGLYFTWDEIQLTRLLSSFCESGNSLKTTDFI